MRVHVMIRQRIPSLKDIAGSTMRLRQHAPDEEHQQQLNSQTISKQSLYLGIYAGLLAPTTAWLFYGAYSAFQL